MPVEGVLNPNNCDTFGEVRTTDYTRARGKPCYRPLLGERSESLSGEAPAALPTEGVLNP